jgi:hypothetical protein
MDTDTLHRADDPESPQEEQDLRKRPTVPPPASRPSPPSGEFPVIPAEVVLEALKSAQR